MIPATFVGPKATFTGAEDPKAHLTAFHTHMMLVGSSGAVHCKLFMSTLVGTTFNWFINLPDGHMTSFAQFSTLFREQYIANRAPPTVSYDLFDVRQYQGEFLKDFLNCFGAQVVRLNTKDENIMVHAFRKEIVWDPSVSRSSRVALRLSARSSVERWLILSWKEKSTRNAHALSLHACESQVDLSP